MKNDILFQKNNEDFIMKISQAEIKYKFQEENNQIDQAE